MIKKLQLIFSVTGFIALFFTSCQSADKDDKKTSPKPPQPLSKVDGYIVSPKLLSQDIELPGSLIPYEETELHPEVSGRVTAIYFKEGANIAQGGLLVKLYDGDLQAQLQKLPILSYHQVTSKMTQILASKRCITMIFLQTFS